MLDKICEYWSVIITLLAAFGITVEILPQTKISPITFIIKWIGKKMLSDTNARLEKLDKEVNDLAVELDDYKCEDLRGIILDFECSLRIGVKHTHDEYMRIFKAKENYDRLIKKRGFENKVVDESFATIERTYARLIDEGRFRYGDRTTPY